VHTRISLLLIIAASITCAQTPKIFAQKLVEETQAAHPEITGLELAATPPGKGCQTIAATEAKAIGETCDKDELKARKWNRPRVEQENDGFDVTVPVHDSAGRIIATAGMDFKMQPGRTKKTVIPEALKVRDDLEERLSLEAELFRPAQ